MSGLIASFKDLEVYQLAFKLSVQLHKGSLKFPKIEQYALADQLRRSSKSVCANIAEGFGRQKSSKIEFKRYLIIAIGSCNETIVWLDYCQAMEYLPKDRIEKAADQYNKVVRMLNSLHSKIK